IREATGAVPRPRSRGSSRMHEPRDIRFVHRGCTNRGIYVSPARGPGPVKSRAGRWLGWLLALVGVGLALKFFTGFPWQVTFAALLGADRWLLVVALAVNLASLVAKGWGWHLILKPVAPHSWRVAQEANLVGA